MRGFVLELETRTGLQPVTEILRWLERVYPRTPIVIHTPASVPDLLAFDEPSIIDARSMDPALSDPSADALRDAMLAVLRRDHRPEIPIVGAQGLTTLGPYLESTLFLPWDDRCTDIRTWLLQQAGLNVDQVDEYLLCTLDASFESLVTIQELAFARGVAESTMGQNLKQIRSLWDVPDVAVLKGRWEREVLGPGLVQRAQMPWMSRQESPRPGIPNVPSARRRRT